MPEDDQQAAGPLCLITDELAELLEHRSWEVLVEENGVSLKAEVLRLEHVLIKTALAAEAGRVSRAAQRLHLSHQGLDFILNTRHKELLPDRTPPRRRRRSIIPPDKRRP